MSVPKQGYVELHLPVTEKSGRRRSIVGGTVVGDYVQDNQRTVLIKTRAPEESKTRAPRKTNSGAKRGVVVDTGLDRGGVQA